MRTIEVFNYFQKKKLVDSNSTELLLVEDNKKSPKEIVDTAYEIISKNLAEELIKTIKSCSPLFFEKMVVDLLIKMG